MKKRKLTALIEQLTGDPRAEGVRAAREQATWRAPDHPELRRALAEHYRRLGEPAVAGRWGIVFPGWARPHEIARLRLSLLQQANGGNFVREHLRLRGSAPVPPEVIDVVAPSFVDRTPRGDGAVLVMGCGGGLIALTTVVLSVLTGAKILWLAFTGQPIENDAVEFLVAGAATGIGALMAVIATRVPSADEKAADPEFAVRRALELLEEHPAEGRAMLQALARTVDTPTVRGALVDDARRRGSASDAGRWGCTEAGLTTPEERDAYASLILRKPNRDPIERLLTLSAVGSSEPIRGDIADVCRRVGTTPPSPPPEFDDLGPRLRWWVAPVLGVPLGAVGCLLFSTRAEVIAAVTVAVVAASWAVLCLVSAASARRPTRRRLIYAAVSAVLATIAAGFVIAAW